MPTQLSNFRACPRERLSPNVTTKRGAWCLLVPRLVGCGGAGCTARPQALGAEGHRVRTERHEPRIGLVALGISRDVRSSLPTAYCGQANGTVLGTAFEVVVTTA